MMEDASRRRGHGSQAASVRPSIVLRPVFNRAFVSPGCPVGAEHHVPDALWRGLRSGAAPGSITRNRAARPQRAEQRPRCLQKEHLEVTWLTLQIKTAGRAFP